MVRRNPGRQKTPKRPKPEKKAVSMPTDIGLPSGEEISFEASIPVKAGAIDVHGDAGLRLVLDVADDNLLPALRMVALRHSTFQVTVKPRLGAVVPRAGEEDGALHREPDPGSEPAD